MARVSRADVFRGDSSVPYGPGPRSGRGSGLDSGGTDETTSEAMAAFYIDQTPIPVNGDPHRISSVRREIAHK